MADIAQIRIGGTLYDVADDTARSSIPTESTVSGWGFTKNSGTYSKPSGGIPKTDLASAIQTSLGKADTAIQSHQDISGKQDKSTLETDVKNIIDLNYIKSLVDVYDGSVS